MVKRLGKGIYELISETASTYAQTCTQMVTIPINSLHPNTLQPRKTFDQETLKELAESIIKNGIIQPIIVRKDFNKQGYEIIAGERRWRASIIAKLTSIPVIIKDINDQQCLEISIIENIQRQDLTLIEEAEAYKNLIDTFSYKHEDLALIVGKSRSHITNMIRILSLPISVKTMINNKLLSFGHARALVNIANAEEVAKKIISLNLNVRQTETIIKNLQTPHKKLQKKESIINLECSLSKVLGAKVTIKKLTNKGQITINFKNDQQFLTLTQKLYNIHS
ncbi:ParB/RepB/Spo0J family partition protein [Neoehrlichia mikurensis]|uniref:ParB/RepB/Spo0J family partition protein n=1 Tax=Neoehrlichia mikurensis TaxID=89586 RepID=A0A9Q9C0D5_9RICK|nr:ParB/RepB/Spo0J family partition protein [Neoehrlichia mikurensis]QXK91586.1 ParB/RepB/Spo0J family partition protein [Neoehrlichia mikurensis]QXK92797.1 ParB/RepB/Spo0J family partition protein [Neoehrlichia mikurensis]QXK93276.1 ParB/RepB/Spo0J family partition protein [Neoehrlichia mikurensis]UTO55794.1 ParB/RepB/Spo0J family partition protein [Neoehrlichia mikurensis]UTO56709.1 ParB/RepB/Spo0J family partition protein [Neoehrlichia mikurensis]